MTELKPLADQQQLQLQQQQPLSAAAAEALQTDYAIHVGQETACTPGASSWFSYASKRMCVKAFRCVKQHGLYSNQLLLRALVVPVASHSSSGLQAITSRPHSRSLPRYEWMLLQRAGSWLAFNTSRNSCNLRSSDRNQH